MFFTASGTASRSSSLRACLSTSALRSSTSVHAAANCAGVAAVNIAGRYCRKAFATHDTPSRALRSALTLASPRVDARTRSPIASSTGISTPEHVATQCVAGALSPSDASNVRCNVRMASSLTAFRSSDVATATSFETQSDHAPEMVSARSALIASTGELPADGWFGHAMRRAAATAIAPPSEFPEHHRSVAAAHDEIKPTALSDRSSPPSCASTKAPTASTHARMFHGRRWPPGAPCPPGVDEVRASRLPSSSSAFDAAAWCPLPLASGLAFSSVAPGLTDRSVGAPSTMTRSAAKPCAAASGCLALAISSLHTVSHPFAPVT
mmetsp:Transcript_4907/g.20208  ORF Transcript_4907/g.20208 Transcript_4907/m.20208 type:complete len:324 (+) Transcript_4907:212-1183(+)